MAAPQIDNKLCFAGLRGGGTTHFCVAVPATGLTGNAEDLTISATQNPHGWTRVANSLKTVVVGAKSYVHARYQVVKTRPNPVADSPEETGQVNVTITGNGGAVSAAVSVPVVYFDPSPIGAQPQPRPRGPGGR